MMNATSNDCDLITSTRGAEKRSAMYAYQVGALQSTMKHWIGEGNAPGLERLSAKNREALKCFIEQQIAFIEVDAKRSAGL